MASRTDLRSRLRQSCLDGNLAEIRSLKTTHSESLFNEAIDAMFYQTESNRPINIAAQHGFVYIVDFLAPFYPDIEYSQECVIAQSLIEKGVHPCQDYPRIGGHSSVYILAVLAGNKSLLANAISVAGFDENDASAAFDSRGRHIMILAARSKQLDCMDMLLNMQVSAHWQYDMLSVAQSIFLTDTQDDFIYLSSSNNSGRFNHIQRYLCSFIPRDDVLLSLLPKMIENGLDIDNPDLLGKLKDRSLLLLCTVHGHFRSAEYLIDQGANVHAVDAHGCNALYYVFAQAYSMNYPFEDTMRLVKKLLAQRIDVNCHEWTECGLGNTPLIEALRTKHFDAAHLLLAAGADPNIRGHKNMHSGFWLFLEPSYNLTAKDISTFSNQSFHLIPDEIDSVTLNMLQALFRAKMEVNVRNKRYQSMRDIAQASNMSSFTLCCQLLMEKEQAVNMKPLPPDSPIPSEDMSLERYSAGEEANKRPRWWKNIVITSSPTANTFSYQSRDHIYEVSEEDNHHNVVEEISPDENEKNIVLPRKGCRCCIIS